MSTSPVYFCSFSLENDSYNSMFNDVASAYEAAIKYATAEGYYPYHAPITVYVWKVLEPFNPSTLVSFRDIFENLEDYDSCLEQSWVDHWGKKATPKAFEELETYFQMYFKKWMRKHNLPPWYLLDVDPITVTFPSSQEI